MKNEMIFNKSINDSIIIILSERDWFSGNCFCMKIIVFINVKTVNNLYQNEERTQQ